MRVYVALLHFYRGNRRSCASGNPTNALKRSILADWPTPTLSGQGPAPLDYYQTALRACAVGMAILTAPLIPLFRGWCCGILTSFVFDGWRETEYR
ncbi:hypothetical protein ASPVEDRAFT_713596 [Aspergillus versicolor CBS 583.65]|uniref:Uncharacterized protein n=1 Tax=Aspergillus versicolor CBS 583.65 TaxID=1036611 RepID=A0A1L9PNG8_ASPVE|nr:uncharacterized protein ASPVEDRAFT_713596 [Aspergillus versicolor CBS 583.65]OJJ03068.1 hypothetical protein ASPVEDRAFT_713596 [Aspergillus versicolor CBS 583.65]